MEDMAEDFGWSLDDFWEDELLTPEEQAAQDRAWFRQQELEAYAELLESPYAHD